jgi:hypothetical protein
VSFLKSRVAPVSQIIGTHGINAREDLGTLAASTRSQIVAPAVVNADNLLLPGIPKATHFLIGCVMSFLCVRNIIL